MKNLTKGQKFIIIFSLLWEMFCIVSSSHQRMGGQQYVRFDEFLTLSLPVFLYWSGVWIWGFGYIKSVFAVFGRKIKKLFCLKTLFSFDGKIGRLDYLGGLIGLYILGYSFLSLKIENIFLFFLAGIFFLFVQLRLVISRANSFTNTPWLYGISFLISFVFGVIGECITAAGYNFLNAEGMVAFFVGFGLLVQLVWFVLAIVLLFKKSKEDENTGEEQGKCDSKS